MTKPTVVKKLFIVGSTASSKTKTAIKISQIIPSYLFSADSRQTFIGMDVVTGKDHPSNFEIAGIDILSPDQSNSVAVWQDSIDLDLEYAQTHGLLPIFVGGTGLYIKSMIEPVMTLGIPVNDKLRRKLSKHSVKELQDQLRKLNPAKLYSMNNSDVNNPRRLIRAIEIASFSKDQLKEYHYERPNIYSDLIIGLAYQDTLVYESMVKKRVIERINHGAIEETKELLKKYSRDLPSMTAIGYKHIISYMDGAISKDQFVTDWTTDEVAYSKRQMTYFKKMDHINWFDPTDEHTPTRVEELVKTWYYGG